MVAQYHQSQLERIKTSVRRSYDYFQPNYDRFNEFRRFVFESSLTADELNLLATMSRPQLEFNILEAYISRLLGEFSKQEPDIIVSADDENTADPMTIKVLEMHIRHTLCDDKNHHTRYEIYKDLLSGGFSALKLMTDYANPMSMDQVIKIERAFDPTLCGFDQLARYSHKGDGRFAFEVFPKSLEDYEEEFQDDAKGVAFKRQDNGKNFSGFQWSYTTGSEKILMVCDFYEKKKKEERILKLTDNKVMTVKKYEEMLEKWTDFTQPPEPVGKIRKTEIETIHRYRCIENRVMEHTETDFRILPIIFVDGNSVLVRTNKDGNIHQVTRPYVYHAKSAQRLKNYAGIALANEIENIVQHKFIIKQEALPKEEEWLDAIKNIQKPSNVVVNAFFEQNPDMPIPEPIKEIIKMPAPPEILQAFSGADSLIQNILGSYDASLGINNNQLSGVAIVEAATQNNAVAMPYIVGFMQGLQRAAEGYVDLFPKYYTTPRTIPIVDEEGKRDFVKINQDEGVDMFYDSNALNVIVKAGASFQVQKSKTIMMVKEMMGMSPLFGQFIAEKGLPFVLDNMEGKGVEQLKKMVDSWLKELQQQKQMAMQAQQAQMQNNPQVMKNQLEMQKLQHEIKKDTAQYELDIMKMKAEKEQKLIDLQKSREDNEIRKQNIENEKFEHAMDFALRHKDLKHTHLKEAIELHHKVSQSTQGEGISP